MQFRNDFASKEKDCGLTDPPHAVLSVCGFAILSIHQQSSEFVIWDLCSVTKER